MFIRWDPKMETGEPLIDAQHRLLVLLFRKLDVAIKLPATEQVINATISEVRRFVEFHFVSEENLMRETGFPGIEEHQAKHVQLLAQLKRMLLSVVTGNEFPEDLLYFLNEWLVAHIGSEDQRVASHIQRSASRPIAEVIYPEFLATLGNNALSRTRATSDL